MIKNVINKVRKKIAFNNLLKDFFIIITFIFLSVVILAIIENVFYLTQFNREKLF